MKKVVAARIKCSNHSLDELTTLSYSKWTHFIYEYKGAFNIEKLENQLNIQFKRIVCNTCKQDKFNQLEYRILYLGTLKL